MSQTKTGASRLQGRLFKSAATSALALSAVVGGVMLSGGQANAAGPVAFPFPPIPPNPVDLVDGRFTLTSVAGPSGVGDIELFDDGDVSIDPVPPVFPATPVRPTAQIDLDFTPNYVGIGSYTYKLKDQGKHFVWSGMIPDGVNGSVVKTIYDDASLTSRLATLDTNPATPFGYSADYKSTTDMIWVKVDYNFAAPGLDNIQDYHQTPGPLPILGAGAAFGFSRKLRGRIKAARSA